jgi:hypothetical protein
MCGRDRRTTAEEEIARQYHIPIPPQLDLPISYRNVAWGRDVLRRVVTSRPSGGTPENPATASLAILDNLATIFYTSAATRP